MRYSTLNRLSDIAQQQWGLVTRQQAERAGVSQATIQRLSTQGVLERTALGVYQLSGAPVPDHADLRAAWLQLAPDVDAGRESQARGLSRTDPRLPFMASATFPRIATISPWPPGGSLVARTCASTSAD